MLIALAKRLVVLSALVGTVAWAAPEVEPNNSCAAPQNLGRVGNVAVSGSIGAADPDFYTLTVAPGALIQVDMRGAPSGAGTLSNMLLGLLAPDCSVVTYSDNSENGFEARLVFIAPSDGVVRFAAGGNPDFSFSGTNTDTGTYTLTIGTPSVPVIAFDGALTDAVNGRALTRDDFAVVNLMSCPSAEYAICTTYRAQGIPDANGHYAIAQALPPGVYQIRVLADNHASYNSAPFVVTGFEGTATRNYALPPLPVVVSDIVPCASLDSGGKCSYSYVLTNTTSQAMSLSVWSQLDQGPNGSPMFRSNYTLATSSGAPLAISLAAGATQKVVQSIPLRGVPAGSNGSVNVYVSTRDRQTDTVGYGFGFNYTVTAADRAVAAERSWQAKKPASARHLDARSSRARLFASGPALISGVAFDPATRQPITDGSVSVQLQLCQDPTFDVCMGTVGLFTVDANGRYTHGAYRLAPGRYQLWAFRQDGSTYGLTIAKPFDYASGTTLVNISAAKAPLKYGPITACAGADALSSGATCVATYELTNVTSSPLTVDLWAVVSSSETGSVKGISQFDTGIDGTSTLRSVTLPANGTVAVSHKITVGQQLPAGTYANMEFFASVPGKPSVPLGNAFGFNVNIVP